MVATQETLARTCTNGVSPDTPVRAPSEMQFSDASADYLAAPELREIGMALIHDDGKGLSHLLESEVQIRWLWRRKAAKAAQKVVLAKCQKVSGLSGYFADADFVIEVAADVVREHRLTHWQLEACLFHEMQHIETEQDEKTGLWTFKPRAHDLEMFDIELLHYGPWTQDLVRARDTFQQAPLFGVASTNGAKEIVREAVAEVKDRVRAGDISGAVVTDAGVFVPLTFDDPVVSPEQGTDSAAVLDAEEAAIDDLAAQLEPIIAEVLAAEDDGVPESFTLDDGRAVDLDSGEIAEPESEDDARASGIATYRKHIVDAGLTRGAVKTRLRTVEQALKAGSYSAALEMERDAYAAAVAEWDRTTVQQEITEPVESTPEPLVYDRDLAWLSEDERKELEREERDMSGFPEAPEKMLSGIVHADGRIRNPSVSPAHAMRYRMGRLARIRALRDMDPVPAAFIAYVLTQRAFPARYDPDSGNYLTPEGDAYANGIAEEAYEEAVAQGVVGAKL